MKRMFLVMLVLVSVGCTSSGGGPPCKKDADGYCQCKESITGSNVDSCTVAAVGSAAACCRSQSYPASTGDCYCAPVVCAALNDQVAFCSCGIGQDNGTPVEQCTGVCCLNTVSGYCYCSNGSGGGCLSGDTPTTTCSVSSVTVSGACGMIYTQTTDCDV